ncbi:MAG: response regulator [Deltaproteobacteria bacterium]|nr:response regulator [Deltaproteobacteria bacterium]
MRHLDAWARIDAALQVERRTLFTTFVIVALALLFLIAADRAGVATRPFGVALAVLTPLALLRLVLFARARALAPERAARRWLVFGPMLVVVAAWAGFATWACVEARGTTLFTVIVATQCLCGAAVVLSYAGVPLLAAAVIVTTVVPVGVAALAFGGADRFSGPGALLFCVMLVSYLPRAARERRAGAMSLLLLAERARGLEEARDAALAAASAKETFFANLSHEIRTPLHGLLGTAERLQGMPLDQPQRDAVEQLHRCGQSLLHTLNDALDAIRLEAGKLQLHPSRVALGELLREVVGTFADQARGKGLSLTLEADVADQVSADAHRLRQVLQNLIGNAVKFTSEGRIDVVARTRAVDDHTLELAIDVADTGAGFAAADGEQLFQRFTPLSARGASGTGLGLSIVADLVRLMGGSIEASSAGIGSGATFRVRVPVARAADDPVELRGRHVLVVDDNPVNLAVARAYLEGLGVRVDATGGGDDALDRAATTRYDAILMDCNMPNKDGFTTTRELRARGDTTPVLAITATSSDSMAERCRSAGMGALVEKPISATSLRDALGRLIGARDA